MLFPNRFREKDAFVGYQKDTPAAAVFQASNQLRHFVREKENVAHSTYLWVEVWKKGFLGGPRLDELDNMKEDSEQWKQAVSSCELCVYSRWCGEYTSCDQFGSLSVLKQYASSNGHTSWDTYIYAYPSCVYGAPSFLVSSWSYASTCMYMYMYVGG